jgi:hypothetical protein
MANHYSLWTHHMKSIRIHRSFKPGNCPFGDGHDAATIGAGVQDGEILRYLAKYNLTTATGLTW